MKRVWPYLIGFAVIVLAVLAWRSLSVGEDATIAGRKKLVVQLQWEPGAQFIGFYVAKARNFYAEEGLSVSFLHAGKDCDPLKSVVTGTAHVGLATADQVLMWADKNREGTESLKALGTVFNRSLACFMSKASSPVTTPQDFRGRNVGVYPQYDSDSILRVLLKRNKIEESEVQITDFPSMQNFVRGDLDVFPSYMINEPVWAEVNQMAVHILDPAEFGVIFYSDTLITTGSYYRDNRDVLKRFIRASAKGWASVEQNPPAESLQLMYDEIRGSIGEGKPREHQAGALREVVKHLRGGPNRYVFAMERSKWEAMQQALFEIKRVSGTNTVDQLCDFSFVDEAMSN